MDVEKLIAAVSKEPILWDKRNPLHSNIFSVELNNFSFIYHKFSAKRLGNLKMEINFVNACNYLKFLKSFLFLKGFFFFNNSYWTVHILYHLLNRGGSEPVWLLPDDNDNNCLRHFKKKK